MRTTIAALIAVLSLALAASAGAATVPVTSLTDPFGATNSSLRLTPDGVNYGVYPDANSGGSLYFSGANGLTLSELSDLDYTFSYTANDEPEGYTAAPYMRVYTEGDAHDVILDPSHCATTSVPHATPVHLQMVGNDVRYDDDGCSTLPETSWDDVVTLHGDEVISGIYITQGFAVGTAFSANVTDLSFNGDVYDFGAPQAGPPSVGGIVTLVTEPTIINRVQLLQKPETCAGNILRVLHSPKRKGWHILSTSAKVLRQGKIKKGLITIKGHAKILLDLTGQDEGNFTVRIKTVYTKESGRQLTRVTTRNPSVACS